MKCIAIYCGANNGNDPIYLEQASLLGKMLAARGTRIVYGGAKVGLMGAIASAALEEGGEVIGILPDFLQQKELAHQGLTELIMVKTMHERKSLMNDYCDGVIALPGGFGTMDELMEMLTWGQLGLHHKPIGLLNIDGFYEPLMAFADKMVEKGFLKPENRNMLLVSDNIEHLLVLMQEYTAPRVTKWISKEKI
ncbi:TIGR00730 family Rossman fold protein [Flavihumibacter rivuli]|uniref:LOG family protein n=1 Tax=Flavihumibacter rivuli TaxID=2838156 RepID=UPI001BDE28B0|nr:TIGR00730 family Rossman fold protein [Flavihumibacter rivuli]ULQ55912.1 TIGR00730 family Rossman fold protein [Flavihumibacter rivuli]